MKRFFFITLLALSLFSCKKEITYVKLSGKILNPNSKELNLHNPEDGKVLKTFTVNDDGTFSDTISLPKGKYFMKDAKEYFMLFLTPGTDLTISYDAENMDNTLKYEGTGSEVNNYIIGKLLEINKLADDTEALFALNDADFKQKLTEISQQFSSKAQALPNADPEFFKSDSTDTEGFINYLKESYLENIEFQKMVGNPSPVFENYENFNGGTTSLKDLKGKYVYIDVWATWCNPCKAEIPALKELETAYGEKMHFVSISVDKEKTYEDWKKMVAEKELKGVQLHATENWDSAFMKAYAVNSIPRFILLDPSGNVVKPNAPRPSNPKTKELIESLLQ